MNRSARLGSAISATGEPSAANAVGSSSSTSVCSLDGPAAAQPGRAPRPAENGCPLADDTAVLPEVVLVDAG